MCSAGVYGATEQAVSVLCFIWHQRVAADEQNWSLLLLRAQEGWRQLAASSVPPSPITSPRHHAHHGLPARGSMEQAAARAWSAHAHGRGAADARLPGRVDSGQRAGSAEPEPALSGTGRRRAEGGGNGERDAAADGRGDDDEADSAASASAPAPTPFGDEAQQVPEAGAPPAPEGRQLASVRIAGGAGGSCVESADLLHLQVRVFFFLGEVAGTCPSTTLEEAAQVWAQY